MKLWYLEKIKQFSFYLGWAKTAKASVCLLSLYFLPTFIDRYSVCKRWKGWEGFHVPLKRYLSSIAFEGLLLLYLGNSPLCCFMKCNQYHWNHDCWDRKPHWVKCHSSVTVYFEFSINECDCLTPIFPWGFFLKIWVWHVVFVCFKS